MHPFLSIAARSLSILLVTASFSYGQGRVSRHSGDTPPRGDMNSHENRGSHEEGPRTNVVIDRELMITDLQVVEDPVRTGTNRRRAGVWSFKYLIEQMAGPNDPAEFALSLFTHGEDRLINGHIAPSRPAVWERIIEPWLAKGGGKLDLRFAPVKLLAIVNRMDLRQAVGDEVLSAGEGRFVFGVLDENGKPLTATGGPAVGGMTIILEYDLPAASLRDLQRWAEDWHALGKLKLGSREYKSHLAMLTQRFTARGRGVGRPNGSALNQIRTNDIALATPWELREWVIDGDSGSLAPAPVAETPDFVTLNNSPELADLLNENADAILDGSFRLPTELAAGSAPAGPFFDLSPTLDSETYNVNLAAAEATASFGVMNEEFLLSLVELYQSNPMVTAIPETTVVVNMPWQTPLDLDPEVRHRFALNTCSGCHRDETGVGFLHVGFPEASRDRDVVSMGLGEPAFLSTFLVGGDPIPDPLASGVSRSFNDLERRKTDLEALLMLGGRHFRMSNRRH